MSQPRTPDQQFARYVKIAIGFFILCFGYFIVADLYMPMTPQARVYHQVTQITPQVNGDIVAVEVSNNEPVKAGQLLMRINPRPYELAVQQAELALAQVQLQNQQLDADISALNADLSAAKARLNEQQRLHKRSAALLASKAISEQQSDEITAGLATAKAQVSAIKAKIQAAKIKRGDHGDNNVALQQAKNALAQAQLNLSYTQVLAPHDGVISNLQVTTGTYAKAGMAMTGLVANSLDLAADFREKSLYHVRVGKTALVSFDALPGQVFSAHVSEFAAGSSDGQLNANGALAQVETSNRWVRDAQRQRIHLQLEPQSSAKLTYLPSGSRATVQIIPDGGIRAALAKVQIKFVSLMHYIY
ncbi:HlyD family secretion protein [Pseudoalteromonas sp. T1lg76]|uniref:HlyD family secretion protein n=1 Tax=Pseudoalteromonas sp. T1lg76 TaxID=2077103 RepID=UPI001F25D14B|nr:HlyD family secretion protein [Pseudoalteromonas sp. T1lg76]